MKKYVQTFAIPVLLAALLTVHASALTFGDVGGDAWYASAVSDVSDIGIMVGDDLGNFNPDKPVTRAEMAIIVCRVLERTLDEDAYAPVYLVSENFPDVPESHWANGYINKVSFLEIAVGYDNGNFGPGDNVTYEQAVTMLVRALGGGDDATAQGGYPKGFLQVAGHLGLLSGLQGAAEGKPLSRANVAVLLSNYFRLNPPEGLPGTTPGSTPGATPEPLPPDSGTDSIPPDDKSDNAPGQPGTSPGDSKPNPGQEIGDTPNQSGDSLEIEDSHQPGQTPGTKPNPGSTGGGT